MAIALLLLVTALAGLAGYLLLGGPRLSDDVTRVIDDVVESELPEIVVGNTGYAASGSIRLWHEALVPAGGEVGTVLLLTGMGADALMWPQPFVRAFLDGGYRVVRFDQRGTGLSDWMEAWRRKEAYSLVDLADDALAVLDHLAIERAHVCGLSLGGMVAQELAIHHPHRVSSLTLMSTSPNVADPALPGPSTSYLLRAAWKGIPLLRYRILGGEKNLVTERIAKMIAFGIPLSSDEVRQLAQHALYDLRKRRGLHLGAVLQHQRAAAISPPRDAFLARLQIPTLVIHGELDPIIPVEHGRKLASMIPGARGLWLAGAGHVFPYSDMSEVMQAILEHLGSAAAASWSGLPRRSASDSGYQLA